MTPRILRTPALYMMLAALLFSATSCSKEENRTYLMTWTSEPTIHENWKGAEDVYLTFQDDPARTYMVVSDDLGQFLRSLGTDTVTTTWKTTVLFSIIDEPNFLVGVEDLETWDVKWSCWILR